ncbi:MAG: cbb3-type cytochrome c oxidase subunit I [Desulfurococcales archaeon]|nr:cbb3-type cytochrome c oxidase subunit I [Desulfurococcales archaeon]
MSGVKGLTPQETLFSRVTIAFSFVILALGGLFGLLQALNRVPYFNLPEALQVSRETYYTILTCHGVCLAVAIPIFWITGFTVYMTPKILGRSLNKSALYLSLVMMLVGAVMATITTLTGKARVLYTFYAPMKAHPAFYLGAALLILGSWVIAFAFFKQYLDWKRANPGKGTPIAVYGLLTTFIVWIEATIPIVITVLKDFIPMSLFGKHVDVLETRTWFWFFGHALVYFWLLPVVTMWYYAIPKRLGVPLFSESMAKVAFILFIIASTPVGLHHQFTDPGLAAGYKYIHTVITLIVATPSMLTAFNILATMERGGRARGGRGLLGWLWAQPWKDPLYAGLVVTLIIFGIGGITGIINASYQLNIVVHNTTWIVGHFHMTVATIVAVGYTATTYALLRDLYGRKLISRVAALSHSYLWLIGILVFSFAYYIAGLDGVPRRTYDLEYGGLAPDSWIGPLQTSAVGSIILFASGVLGVYAILGSLLLGKTRGYDIAGLNPGNPHDPPAAFNPILENLRLWVIVAAILIIVAYILPFYEMFSRGLSPVPPVEV